MEVIWAYRTLNTLISTFTPGILMTLLCKLLVLCDTGIELVNKGVLLLDPTIPLLELSLQFRILSQQRFYVFHLLGLIEPSVAKCQFRRWLVLRLGLLNGGRCLLFGVGLVLSQGCNLFFKLHKLSHPTLFLHLFFALARGILFRLAVARLRLRLSNLLSLDCLL